MALNIVVDKLIMNVNGIEVSVGTNPKKKLHGIYEIEIEANNFQGLTHDFMTYDSVRKEFTDVASYLRVDPLPSEKEEEEFRVKLSKIYTELISLGLVKLK